MLLTPIVEIFCDIDDFCKEYFHNNATNLLPNPERIRYKPCTMSVSEIICIIVLFHMSQYRTLKDFYYACVLHDLHEAFPNAVSYNRFVELEKTVLMPLSAYLLTKLGKHTSFYYIDSTKLAVCHNKRIGRHRVFKDIAQRGKTSMGWFFGFKLHIVINEQGELVNLSITKGNVSDSAEMEKLFKGLTGIGARDKGYISKEKTEALEQQGLKFIHSVRKNMKKKMMTAFEKFFLSKRGLVETVIEQLKSICQIEHSRHRSPDNFVINLISGLVAYCLKPRKPTISLSSNLFKSITVMSN
jgi:hypothetical protein